MIAQYLNSVLRLLAVTSLMLSGLAGLAADSKEMKLEIDARLIWGTNDEKSPNPNHKAVAIDPELARKLQKCPLKWTNYFLVNDQHITVPAGVTKKIKMSERCTVEVRNLGDRTAEVKLIGEGKPWGDPSMLKEGLDLLFVGRAENDTAWIVYLKSHPKEDKKPEPDGKQGLQKGKEREDLLKSTEKPPKQDKPKAPGL